MIMNEPKRFQIEHLVTFWIQRTQRVLIIEPLKRVLYRTF